MFAGFRSPDGVANRGYYGYRANVAAAVRDRVKPLV